MSKRKVPVSKRTASRALERPTESVDSDVPAHITNDVVRFLGISLAGGKSDKACVALIEYYPKNKKIFLSRLFEKLKSEEKISVDLKIHDLIDQNKETLEYVAFDIPWNLPACLTCVRRCPGYENCNEEHIQWMWNYHDEKLKKKKPKKIFTPYTQRCVEMYFSSELEETFTLHHAMGSNSAPLLARAQFIKKRLDPNLKCIEVNPGLTLWRVGQMMNMMKSQLRNHRAAFGGDESRKQFLHNLNEKNLTFIYHQDMKQMIENSHAFEAFLCALTGFLKYKDLTESRPKNFPKQEDWIEFPKENIKVKDFE
ncbi:MAG: hypothetical protein A2622_13140 [Bdellovibrionales bacterium RIFCSPHIGHO2_01_FULL_40_29]|nr:MAG: hypothetical protein A2622_13140 [Bdellovibrionales bacterium RIFCSPHIGHO2_01_FULL_40_29]OFZ33474.1 MAG: hypothetical protein A3D17_13745 [Bdellovibrionales bacterium RIFCSPHIGHO2_02_FULL_40_15]